jgi:hypothetical protein
MASSISAWKMQMFQRDVSTSLMRGAMDDVAQNVMSLIDAMPTATPPSTGMMDIRV